MKSKAKLTIVDDRLTFAKLDHIAKNIKGKKHGENVFIGKGTNDDYRTAIRYDKYRNKGRSLREIRTYGCIHICRADEDFGARPMYNWYFQRDTQGSLSNEVME